MDGLLEPLPETITGWQAAGCPLVHIEVRDELTYAIVGTVKLFWGGRSHGAEPVVRVRAVVDRLGGVGSAPYDERLARAIARAERARRRSIRPCVRCAEPTPPEGGERMGVGFACHGCMSEHYGVVF